MGTRSERRIGVACAATVALVLLSGCSPSHATYCKGTSVVADRSTVGTDPHEALLRFVASAQGRGLPTTGWVGPVDGVFTSGSARVTVATRSGEPGWVVTAVSTCTTD